jgi:hypothetical protein
VAGHGDGDVDHEGGETPGRPGQGVCGKITKSPVQGAQTNRMAKIAIYTAIFGAHDDLKPQPACPGVDFVCFTDDASMRSDQWRMEVATARHDHPRLAATWFRTHPHVVLPEYRHTIWIDGSMVLRSESFAEEALGHLKQSGIALMRHPRRADLLQEVEVSLGRPKYDGQPIREQLEHYRAQGFPTDHGLWVGGLLVRDNENERIRRLNEMWMEETARWSHQNQISLAYVLWRLGIEPDEIPLTGRLRDNDLFRIEHHLSAR